MFWTQTGLAGRDGSSNLMQLKSFPTRMHTKPAFRSFIFLFLAWFSLLNCVRSEEKALSKEEILALLPRGVDLYGEELLKLEKLVSIGSSAYEVLGAELVRLPVDEWLTASRIITVFEKSNGDKSIARRYLTQFLDIPRSEAWWKRVQTEAAEAIRKFDEAQTVQSPTPKENHARETKPPSQTSKLPEAKVVSPSPSEESAPPRFNHRYCQAAAPCPRLPAFYTVFSEVKREVLDVAGAARDSA